MPKRRNCAVYILCSIILMACIMTNPSIPLERENTQEIQSIPLITKAQAKSVIYNMMYYNWSGVLNSTFGYSYQWNGIESYTYQSGTLYVVNETLIEITTYDSSKYTSISHTSRKVNNNSRLITFTYPPYGYCWANNSHDWVWIFPNVSIGMIVPISIYSEYDHGFNVTKQVTIERLGKSYNCWRLTDSEGSIAYYDNESGLLISGKFASYLYNYSIEVTSTNAPNNFAPVLSNGFVSPSNGTTTTLFKFSVNYTDLDNNIPIFINLILDEGVFVMTKQNPADSTYTDGVIYVYSTYLTNRSHTYGFNATDGKFFASIGPVSGPYPVNKMTYTAPLLLNPELWPPHGHNLTKFTFKISYIDFDNDPPIYMNLTINGISHAMIKQNPADIIYLDGVIYTFSTTLAVGNYTYFFSTSDPDSATTNPLSGFYPGPNVTAAYRAHAVLFNGMVYSWSGKYMGIINLWGTEKYYREEIGFQAIESFTVSYIGGQNTYEYIREINNDSRAFSSYGGPWGAAGHEWVWIFTNTTLGDTIPIALFIEGDHLFTVVADNEIVSASGKNYICWKLIDNFGSIAFYDKKYGLLVSGIFYVEALSSSYTISLSATNARVFTPPALTMGSIFPLSGDTATNFTFAVKYSDPDNDPPSYIYVIIDGVAYQMKKQDPSDNNYVAGVIYVYETKLGFGYHKFYFNVSDGANTTRCPLGETYFEINVPLDPLLIVLIIGVTAGISLCVILTVKYRQQLKKNFKQLTSKFSKSGA